MESSNNVGFSTFNAPHGNAGGRCVEEHYVANWYDGTGGFCNVQSVNGEYRGKNVQPSPYNRALYWSFDKPLKTIQLMVIQVD